MPWGARAGWLALATSLGAYVLLSVVILHQPFHVGDRALRFFDLRVYRGAARLILQGAPLYGHGIVHGLQFTYPPLAAIVLTPLAAGSLPVDELAMTGLGVVALVAVMSLTLRIANRPQHMVALAAAAALWLEPVTTALGYGQIDVLIALLVAFDVSRPDRAKTKGAAIGLAAGMKLTPLIFVPYLLLTGRRRAAALAAGVFALTVALGFAALPGDSAHYWGGAFAQSGRVGPAADYANQSLWGTLARLTGTSRFGLGALMVIATVAVLGLGGAVLAHRRGDEGTAFSLCAITGLLISPVSWTHHWVIAVPALVLLVVKGCEQRSAAKLGAAAVVAWIGYAYIPERARTGELLAVNCYVLIGLAAIAGGWVAHYRSTRAASPASRRKATISSRPSLPSI